jgi:sugar lactone lactonase YvrE
MERSRRVCWLALLTSTVMACGETGQPTPPQDAATTDSSVVDDFLAPADVDDGGSANPSDASSDAGTPDAGPLDAGQPDAGPPDAGPLDAGPPDTGPLDAGPADAGQPDAGPLDAGPRDAGPLDAGNPRDVPIDTGRDVLGDAASDMPEAAVGDVGRDVPTDTRMEADAGCRADLDCGTGRVCVSGVCVQRGGGAFFPPPPSGFATVPSQVVEGCGEPIGLAFSADGFLYASCIRGGRVVRVDPATGAMTNVATGIAEPLMIRLADARNLVVTDRAGGRVWRIPLGPDGLAAGSPTTLGSGWSGPTGLTLEPAGTLLVINQASGVLDRLTLGGAVTRGVLTGVSNAVEVEFDPAGRLWLSDYRTSILRYSAQLTPEQPLTGFDHPVGVVFDAAGNAYVADSRFGRRAAAVIRVSPSGVRTEVITGLDWPHDLAFDARGNLWVVDYGSDRLLRFNVR